MIGRRGILPTGGRARTVIAAAALCLASLPVAAQPAGGLTCRADVDRRRIAPDEQVVLTLQAAWPGAQAPRHEMPAIADVEVIAGGTGQSFSLDAGGSRISVTATYYLRSLGGGDFVIPPVVFQAGAERCQTEPIAIDVADPSQPDTGSAPAPAAPPPDRRPTGRLAGKPGDDSFITLEVDRDEVWLGEQIILTFRYHRLRRAWGQPSYTPPRTEGFWRIDLPPERNYRRNLSGQVYEITEIRYALFPTRSGALTIEPARLELAGDPFERFFGRSGRPRHLQTDPMTVTVRNWPAPRPDDFSGIAAGRLEITAGLDRRQVPRGEPVTLSVQVAADAFLKGFGGLAIPEIPGARLYDSREDLREDTSGPRYAAVFTQEKALVPVQEGNLTLPPLDLVYFDTQSGTYRTARARIGDLQVAASDLPVAGDDPSGFRRAEIARLGRDLAFVHPQDGPLRRQAPPLVHHGAWWFALLAPWFLLLGDRWRRRRRDLALRDPAAVRRRRAWPQASRALKVLHRRGSEPADLSRAILQYVGDHLDRTAAGLTAAEVRRWCEGLGCEAAGGRLAEILATCDRVRFGGRQEIDVRSLAGEVHSLLRAVEQRLQRAPQGASRSIVPFGVLALWLIAAGSAGIGGAASPETSSGGADPARLLAEGNQAYTAGDLDEALRLYREALRGGGDDAILHYNLGNALARRGELGRAIASYLRAQRLAPRDPDVRANLAWVRSNTRDLELVEGSLPPVVAQLHAAVHLLSLDEWSWLLLLLSWLTALALAWTARRAWTSASGRRWRLLLAALTLLTAVSVGTRWYAEVLRDVAVVVADEVAVRGGPSESFPVVFEIHDGLTLEIRGERDGWARIGLGGDWVGWVPGDALERVRREHGTGGGAADQASGL